MASERKISNCKKHGQNVFIKETSGYWRCSRCRSTAVGKRRKKIRKILVEERGAKCEICGYNRCRDALEFHHNDDNKEFSISGDGVTRSLDKARKEADKCMLICANCHREIHSEFGMFIPS